MILMNLKGCRIGGKKLRLGKNFYSNTLVCPVVRPQKRPYGRKNGRPPPRNYDIVRSGLPWYFLQARQPVLQNCSALNIS